MTRRNEWSEFGLQANVAVSTNTFSPVINLRGWDIIAPQVVLTDGDTPNVVVTLQGALLEEGTYTDIEATTLTDNGSALFNIVDPGYQFAKIKFEWNAGDGALAINVSTVNK